MTNSGTRWWERWSIWSLMLTLVIALAAEGNVSGALETLQDTTDRRHAIQERLKAERRFHTLLDFAPYSILVYTIDGLVTYVNPAFTETFGWTLEEFLGHCAKDKARIGWDGWKTADIYIYEALVFHE